MNLLNDFAKPTLKKGLALGQIRPLDPVQVLFLQRLELAFLVVSKNACSSVKESFISTALGNLDLPFDKVHNFINSNDALLEENGLLVRSFVSWKQLNRFLQHKNLLVIQRPIVARARSGYADYRTGKNKMIFPRAPAFSLAKGKNLEWDFDQFNEAISRIDDYLSDRHYRSQSFLWGAIPGSCNLIKVDQRDLSDQFISHPLLKDLLSPKKRNSTQGFPEVEISAKSLNLLRERYSADIAAGIPFS